MKLLLLICFLLLEASSAQDCPPNVPVALCSDLPCDVTSCPARRDATCTNNFCGGCNAIFTDANGNILSTEDCQFDNRCFLRRDPYPPIGICPICPLTCPQGEICCPTGCGTTCIPIPSICPPHKPPVNCLISPCSVNKCPGVPSATCTDDYCGGCNAIFRDSSGRIIRKRECRKSVSTCPSPVDPRAYVPFRVSCTKGNRVGSICTARCPRGQQLQGGTSVIVCLQHYLPLPRWSPSSFDGRTCAPSCSNSLNYCPYNPCKYATCYRYPKAKCVVDRCNCSFYFKLRGRRLSRRECIGFVGKK